MTATRVLVTGAGGYLGGRLVAYLRKSGSVDVRAGSRVLPANASLDEAVAIGELTDDDQLLAACRDATHVIHLAALNEIDSERSPEKAIEVTVTGTVRLMRAARRAGVRRVIYLSSAHVYGAPLAGRIDEERATRPVHPYAITHRAAEDFVFAGRSSALEAVVLRLSNAVGAPSSASVPRWTLLVNDLCRQVVTTGKLSLRSSGRARRDFIAMSDACRAVEHMIQLPSAQLPVGALNLGGGRSMRVIDMVMLVADRAEMLLGARPAVERPAPAPGEMDFDLDYRIDRLLATGFQLRGDLVEEIDQTLELCITAFQAERTDDTPRERGVAR